MFALSLALTGVLWFAQRTRGVRDWISAALIGLVVAVVGLSGMIVSGDAVQAETFAAVRTGVMLFSVVGSSVLLHLLVARTSRSGTAVAEG